MSIDVEVMKKLFIEAHERLERLRCLLPFSEVETIEACDDIQMFLKKLEEQMTPTERPKSFYPPQGTVFIDCVQGKDPRPLIVQDPSELVSRSQKEVGWIAFYDTVEGMGEYPRWFEDLKSGMIKVVWCPAYGSFSSNEDYLKSWGLT